MQDISLFNITINKHIIDTTKFDDFVSGNVVQEFEERFCEYVGAKYCCSVNSATFAIFLCLLNKQVEVTVPTILPPVVCNAILTSGNTINFKDDVSWVGGSYTLHQFDNYKIVDSAQKVERNQFSQECNDNDLAIFSFYPTKPIGSYDGGMIVSNDLEKITQLKILSNNGRTKATESWKSTTVVPGYKLYMSNLQAYIALKGLKALPQKDEKLQHIRKSYNDFFNLNNTSNHLYRIYTPSNTKYIQEMKKRGIQCGIHYACCHQMPSYEDSFTYEQSERQQFTTASIPFHEQLTPQDIQRIKDEHTKCIYLKD